MQDNPGLCGLVPSCLIERIPNLSGTGLMDPRNLTSNPNGGLCDELPPSCLPEHGCRCVQPQHKSAFSAPAPLASTCQSSTQALPYGACMPEPGCDIRCSWPRAQDDYLHIAHGLQPERDDYQAHPPSNAQASSLCKACIQMCRA